MNHPEDMNPDKKMAVLHATTKLVMEALEGETNPNVFNSLVESIVVSLCATVAQGDAEETAKGMRYFGKCLLSGAGAVQEQIEIVPFPRSH